MNQKGLMSLHINNEGSPKIYKWRSKVGLIIISMESSKRNLKNDRGQNDSDS